MLSKRGARLLICVLRTPVNCGRGIHSSSARTAPSSAEPPTIDVEPVLYPTHIPTSCAEKAILAAGSAAMALYDPTRDDMVAALGETTGTPALKAMLRRMQCDSVGQEILRVKPIVNTSTVDMDWLRQLPSDTFGYAYANFMDSHGYSPNARAAIKYVDDPELAYVMQRYREVHDFLHTLTGLPTSVFGEVVLKWYELLQTGMPMCALSSLFGPLQLSFREQLRLLQGGVPWAVQASSESHFFMNVYYERHFEEPLDSLRTRVHIQRPNLQ